MKKIFTLFVLALIAIGANAQNWQLVQEMDYTQQTSYPYWWMGDNNDQPNFCGGTATVQVTDGALVIYNSKVQDEVYSLQPFILDWFNLVTGVTYLLKIDMEASGAGSCWLPMGTWSSTMPKYGVNFAAGDQTLEVLYEECTASASSNDAHVLFQCGGFEGTVKIYKVQLYKDLDTEEPDLRETFDVIRNGDLSGTCVMNFWSQEWKDGTDNYNGPSIIEDEAIKVYVRSEEQAYAAGNPTLTEGGDYADWDSQFFITWPEELALQPGDKLKLKMKVKADVAATIGTQCQAAPGQYIHWFCVGDVNFDTDWTEFESQEITVQKRNANGGFDWGRVAEGTHTIAFNLAKGNENTFYFDDIELILTTVNTFDTSVNHVLEISNGEPAENVSERQAIHVLDEPLVEGKTYIVKATIYSETGGDIQLAPVNSKYTEGNAAPLFAGRMNALENGVQYLDIAAIEAGKSSRVTWKFIAEAPFDKLQFLIGKMGGKVILDDVSCMEQDGNTELIVNGDFEEQFITNWNVLLGQRMKQSEGELDDPVDIDATPTTGIATPTTISADQPAVRYDLSGRRVDASYKGVVIMNGKKTVNN